MGKGDLLWRPTSVMLLLCLIMGNGTLKAQCTTNLPIAQKFCSGDQPIFDVTGATSSDKYSWYTYSGSTYSFQQYNNTQFVGSSGGVTPPTFYYYEKEITGTVGATYVNAHTTAAQNLANTDSLRQSFTNDVAVRVNSVQIAVRLYNNTNVRVQVNVGSQFSAWYVFNASQATLAPGATNIYLVTVPVNLTVPAGTHSLAVRSVSSGTVAAVDGFVNFANSSNFAYPYTLGASGESLSIAGSGNNSGIFKWDVTRLCGKNNIIPVAETPANCCQPITDLISIAAKDTIVSGTVSDPITVSGVSGTAYYKWYLDGVAISGAEGVDLKSYTATKAGTYGVRIVRDQAKLANPNCYELKLVDIQERQLFATPKNKTVCLGESVALSSSGALGSYNWTYLNGASAAGILNSTTVFDPVATPTAVGDLTLKLTADVSAGNLVKNGDFEAGNDGSFSTNYTYTASPTFGSCLGNPGYSIQTVSNGCCIWLPCTDANGGGKFFYGDPNNQTPNDNVWSQNVVTAPNQDYIFSAFFTNISSIEGVTGSAICASPPGRVIVPANYTTKDIDPVFQVFINNQAVGGTHTTTGSACDWTEHRFTWNSGAGGQANISIRIANATQGGGNAGKDFGMDKVSFFTAVKKQADTVHIKINDCNTLTAQALACTGDSVPLLAATNGNFIGWKRKSDNTTNGIGKPASLATNVYAGGSVTYTATAKFQLGNLITNGDFSDGNAGITSSYANNNYNTNSKEYKVTSTVTASNTTYGFIMPGGVGGAGSFMVSNNSGGAANAVIWGQSVALAAAGEYLLSLDLANIVTKTISNGSIPNITIKIGTSTYTVALTSDSLWKHLSFVYTAASAGNVSIQILNQYVGTNVNGLAIDNIVFAPTITKTADVVPPICLGVKFISFQGIAIDGKVLVKWLTSHEDQIRYFVVQRSVDGVHFENLQIVDPHGGAKVYEVWDTRTLEGTKYYYRIQEVPRVGPNTYSNTLFVELLAKEKQIYLYPNPSQGAFVVDLKSYGEEEVPFQVFTSKGSFVQNGYFLPTELNMIGNGWDAGVYILKVEFPSGIEYHKMFKE